MSLDSMINDLGLPIGLPVENWKACQPPPASLMSGRFCALVPTDAAAHGLALFESFDKDTDRGNWTYLPYGPFASSAEFVAWLSEACAGQDPLFHTVLNGDNVPVGLATYLRVDPGPGVIEVGHIHFSPLMQRTPMATEAMYLMMRRVFDELGYRRYEWKCNALNAPSCAAATRLGFSFEGVFRQAAVVKGHNRDTAWYSILDSEWPLQKQAFESWLSAENFDPQGNQIRSLKQCREMLLAGFADPS